jgi:ubiquinone/menaquinone biosynthesis C-methylase UbiE
MRWRSIARRGSGLAARIKRKLGDAPGTEDAAARIHGGAVKDTDSPDYWQRDSAKFTSHYEPQAGGFSLKRLVGSFLNARTRHLLEMADVGPGDAVLDVGCGSGVHVKLFAPRCRSIVGIDYSSQMIATAESHCRDLPARNWEFRVGDAHDLPFPDASFDCILNVGLLDYVASPQRVLEECRRVLKDDGRIVFTTPKRPTVTFLLHTSFGDVLRDRLFDLPPIRNSFTSSELGALLGASRLRPGNVRSMWTAIWIARATKEGR